MTPDARSYAAVAKANGPDGVVRGLISRHNQRWDNVRTTIPRFSDPVAESLHVVFPLDVALWRCGVRFDEHAANPSGDWPQHLRWAIDSACQAQRLLLASNLLGAAALARTQLERWSANRATSNNIVQGEGVPTNDFYDDLWAAESPLLSGGHAWTELSELLHGRGSLVSAVRWESAEISHPSSAERADSAVAVVETAVQLALRQVLLCIGSLMVERGMPKDYEASLRMLPLSLPSEVRLTQAAPALWPLTYTNIQMFGQALAKMPDLYLDDVRQLGDGQKPRPLVYSARSLEAFKSRRARARATARFAFDAEIEELREQFNPAALTHRELGYILINESAGLLGLWSTGPASDALVVGAAALRASFWLWLEDDDRALVLARTLLEQTARLRTWRLKPEKAQGIENRGSRASSRDWLEAAGWRRLSVLNRSLGEFSHSSPALARWSGARSALAALQAPAEDRLVEPIKTARGDTLQSIAFAFGSEVRERAQLDHPAVAEALSRLLPYAEDGAPDEIEGWLERCWQHRGLTFGNPDFIDPS